MNKEQWWEICKQTNGVPNGLERSMSQQEISKLNSFEEMLLKGGMSYLPLCITETHEIIYNGKNFVVMG